MAATTDDLLELATGAMAAGGGCVARAPDGRVVFVRHALPDERVVARVTEVTAHYLRADAIEILQAAPGRVEPPCPAAGPGRCGGCDWQHVHLEEQRRIKAGLVREQLARLAGLDMAVEVEPLPGAPGGLGWRTRVRFAADRAGHLGLRRHRSHRIEPLEACPIAAPGVEAVGAERLRWPGADEVEVHAAPDGAGGARALVDVSSRRPLRSAGLPRLAEGIGLRVRGRQLAGPARLSLPAAGHRFQVSPGSFWQVHPDAPDALVRAVLQALSPQPGEAVADLYAGVGLFTVVLAEAVGPTGRVVSVERSAVAEADARANTAGRGWIEVRRADVSPAVLAALGPVDLVVLDPPREGAGRALATALASLEAPPRAIAYVACDPASFARDLAVLLGAGWSLRSLRAFDLFPMTEHVELVAALVPSPDAASRRLDARPRDGGAGHG